MKKSMIPGTKIMKLVAGKNSEAYKKKTQMSGKTKAERSDKHESPSL